MDLPLGFRVRRAAARSPVIAGGFGREVFTVEARQLAHHQKEAVVAEGAGSAWRLASDEGAHLKGTDLAPFPLGFFNAGLQSDLANRVLQLSRLRGLTHRAVDIELGTHYSLTGSFALGTGQGVAEGVSARISFDTAAAPEALSELARDAMAASPAFAAVERPLENTFALYLNGRRRNPATLPASPAADAPDPFMTYRRAPAPTGDGGELSELIAKTGAKQPGTPSAAPAAATGASRIIRTVEGRGSLTDPGGLFETTVALNLPGSTLFAFKCDESAQDRGPSGLALFAAGIAFCYMTQLSRYIEHMKLPIRAVRLVQYAPYAVTKDAGGGPRGGAEPVDTHLFLHGEADDETFEKLQRVAANTCYLHQTLLHPLTPRIEVLRNGELIQ